MPPGEFEDRQQVKREQEMIRARRKVKVYAVLMALLWAAAIPINVIVARQNPWAVFVIAGTGAALLIYWLRYRKAVRELRRYQHNTGKRDRVPVNFEDPVIMYRSCTYNRRCMHSAGYHVFRLLREELVTISRLMKLVE